MRNLSAHAVLIVTLLWTQVSLGQDRLGKPPEDVSATKTPSGILFTCRDPQCQFTLELVGKQYQPLSNERLIWRIDDMQVELLVGSADVTSGQDDADTLRRYAQQVLGRPELKTSEFSLNDGTGAILWSVPAAGADKRLVASAVNGKSVVNLTVDGVGDEHADAARGYLKQSLSTLKRGVGGAPAKPAALDSTKTGATLQEQLTLHSALTGEEYVAFLNSDLATATDREVRGAVPIGRETLVELALLMLESHGSEALVSASVFDGRVAHAINLDEYRPDTGEICYWDPWGKGSFLEAANNDAGVKAQPHPTRPRIWIMKVEDLERTLYSVILSLKESVSELRLCALLAGPPGETVATYRMLHDLDPKNPEVSEARFERLAQRFVRLGDSGRATTLYATKWSLFPPEKDAKDDAIRALRAHTNVDPESELEALFVAATPPVSAAPPRTLQDVLKSDFITFFNLKQSAETNTPSGKTLEFRPTATQFRSRVQVHLDVDQSDALRGAELLIDVSFIEDRADGMFAQDFVKSFIAFAVPPIDAGAVQGLVDEIWDRRKQTVPVPVPGATRGGTAVPKIPSLGCMTFLVLHPQYTQTLPSSVLRLERQNDGDQSRLRIAVTPR